MNLAALRKRIHRLLSHAFFKIGMGLVLVGSSMAEVVAPWLDGSLAKDLGAEHGVLLFGLTHVMKSVLDLFEGADDIREAARGTVGEEGK